jgi:hypothetical protein
MEMVADELHGPDEAVRHIYREREEPTSMATASRRKTAVGVLLFLIGLACLAFTVVQLAQDVSLWVFGTQVEADVVDLWAEPTGEAGDGSLAFRYYVRFQFSTSDGQRITGTSTVGPNEWIGLGTGSVRASRGFGVNSQSAPVYHEQSSVPQEGIGGLEEGGSIDVVYFAPYPQHHRLEESRLIPLLACGYVPLLGASVVGLVIGWRTARQGPI